MDIWLMFAQFYVSLPNDEFMGLSNDHEDYVLWYWGSWESQSRSDDLTETNQSLHEWYHVVSVAGVFGAWSVDVLEQASFLILHIQLYTSSEACRS